MPDCYPVPVQDLADRYGKPLIVLNLVKGAEKRPRESILQSEFANAISYINKGVSCHPGGTFGPLPWLKWEFCCPVADQLCMAKSCVVRELFYRHAPLSQLGMARRYVGMEPSSGKAPAPPADAMRRACVRPVDRLVLQGVHRAQHTGVLQAAEEESVEYIPWDFKYFAKLRGNQILEDMQPVIRKALTAVGMFICPPSPPCPEANRNAVSSWVRRHSPANLMHAHNHVTGVEHRTAAMVMQ